ncbi:MAG: DUF2085 domain-containing protein [Candidatus Sericytochromatia bacterium]|nr:DUF2085 domain-containing protein [Candidatus Sericytochromatia bacterium]
MEACRADGAAARSLIGLCHQLPARSLFFGAEQFPLCARCMGGYLGFALGGLWLLATRRAVLLCPLLVVFGLADKLVGMIGGGDSTNEVRVLLGLMLGSGLSGCLWQVGLVLWREALRRGLQRHLCWIMRGEVGSPRT